MLSLKALALILSASALAAPAPVAAPAEVTPEDRAGSPDDPTWYCQWRHRVLWEEYTLEGHRWGSAGAEDALRQSIGSHGGWITGWRYEENEDGSFRAKWNLPLRMAHNVEDNLNQLLAPPDAHGILCHKAH